MLWRRIERVVDPEVVIEGAGVRLRRSIGTGSLDHLDPFLLLDHFASTDPQDYRAGFPWHPHRGMETVTYVLSGVVHHKDTLGNSGSVRAGEVQWMTAGRGILHEEMPEVRPEGIDGFQLWVNLPARLKMTAPRYQNIPAGDIPELQRDDGARIRVIAGTVDDTRGPISGIAVDPLYLDIFLPPQAVFVHPITRGYNAFSYIYDGRALWGREEVSFSSPRLIVWGDGEAIKVRTEEGSLRFLLVAGRPLNEPIVRYGPFVMNTWEEIEETLRELREGTFARKDGG